MKYFYLLETLAAVPAESEGVVVQIQCVWMKSQAPRHNAIVLHMCILCV